MKCLYCGSDIKEGSAYCEVCGAQLISEQNIHTDISTQNDFNCNNAQQEQPVFCHPFVERGQMTPNNNAGGYNNANPTNITNESKKSGKGPIIILSSIIGVLTIGIVIVLILLLGSNKDSKNDTSAKTDTTENRSTSQNTSDKKTDVIITGNVTEESKTEQNTSNFFTEPIIETDSIPSREEAKEAFDQLYKKAFQYCKDKNMQAYFDLFTSDTGNDYKNQNYTTIEELLEHDYPNIQSDIIWDNGEYFIGFVMTSLTTKSGSNTNSRTYSAWWVFRKENNEWKFDGSVGANTAMLDEKTGINAKIYDKRLFDAYKDGRNFATFDVNDLSWVNEKMVVPGNIEARMYYAWQEEDGSVYAFVNIKNGTDVIQNITNIHITMNDDDLETVFDEGVGSAVIDPNSAQNVLIKLDPSSVKTGIKKWKNLHANTHIDY